MSASTPSEISRVSPVQPSTGLVPLGEALAGWVCERIQLESDDTLSVKLRRLSAIDWAEIIVTKQTDQAVFKRLEHCQVRYRARVTERTPAIRAALGDVILSIASSVDRALAARPDATIAEAMGRQAEPLELTFGRDALLALLGPHLPLGATVCGEWTFVDVTPSTQVRGLKSDRPFFVLDFRHLSNGRRVMFQLQPRVDDGIAFVNTANFSITLVTGMGDIGGSEALQAFVGFLLQLHDHAGIRWRYPESLDVNTTPAAHALLAPSAEEVGALLAEKAGEAREAQDPETAEVLNLSIISECAQQCNFCSVKETNAPKDGGEATFASLCRDLLETRRRGVRRVRINGYDPLSFSKIVETIAFARELGYDYVQIFSPCTRLADPAFCDAVLGAIPDDTEFMVPLYALDAATHDKVVGRPGAFELVMTALERLRARIDPGHIHLLTVITADNPAAIHPIWTFAAEKGFHAHAHLPYPSFESRGDRYYGAAARQSEVVVAAAQAIAASPPAFDAAHFVHKMMEGVAPCVNFRGMTAFGVPVKRWLKVREVVAPLPGTEYRDERYHHRSGEVTFQVTTIPCPHATTCVLASACPREILRSYSEMYGIDEFKPVALGELLESL